MLNSRDEKCHAIIHGASVASGATGAGLAQIPLADNIPITTIQVGMIVSIAKVFDIDLTEGAAKGLIAGFATSVAGRNIAGVLVGWLPGIGNTIKATTAVALTEAIGWATVKHFENLEEEQKNSFNSGIQIGEKKAKEKFNDILEKCKERDNFFVVMYGFSIYLGDNYTHTDKIVSICTDGKTLERLQITLNNIDKDDPIKFIKEFIIKIDENDLEQIQSGINVFNDTYEGIDENKIKLSFELCNNIKELKNITKNDNKKIIQMLNILMPNGDFYE